MIPRVIPPWWGGGDLELRELVQARGGGDHHFAEWFARSMTRMAQETGYPASGTLESEAKSAITVIVKCKPVTAGPTRALSEQPMRMAQETGELVQAKDGGDHLFAEWFSRGMIRTAQETNRATRLRLRWSPRPSRRSP